MRLRLPMLRLVVAVVLATAILGAEAGVTKPSTSISFGKVTGAYCSAPNSKIRRFLGIPFAKAPVGTRRFAAPRAWDTKYPNAGIDATKYGPQCMQPGAAGTSEDCLFLNIWTPSTSSSAKLPVRVFIHGGGYQTGSGSDPAYDGCKVSADGNVVSVTINYRLGVLGFLALPTVNDSTANGTTGNWGLLDQRMALKWIQANIRAFGGDPARVLLTGESAGAYSTFLHTLMPGSKGLFAATAPISGSTDVMASDLLPDAYAKGNTVATALGCTKASTQKSCLLSKSASAIIAAQASTGVQPFAAVDGVAIPKAPLRLMQEGKTARVPVMIGVNANEGVLEGSSATGFNTSIDVAGFAAALQELVPVPRAFYGRLLAQYNDTLYGSWFGALTKAITEGAYWCPSYRMARAFAKSSASPVRFFVLDLIRPTSGCSLKTAFGLDLGEAFADWFGAYHSYDIGFTFMAPRRPEYTSQCNFTKAEAQMSSFMSGILSSFAATQSPTPARSASLTETHLRNVAWPAWSSSSKPVLFLSEAAPATYQAPDVLDGMCKLWDDILAYNVQRNTNRDE